MDIFDFHLIPLTHGGLYWPSQKMLLVADLHLGKDASFCREGIAVPRGSSQKTLHRIREMLNETQATGLGILGDLFHARSSLAKDIRLQFASFLESISGVSVTLVLGNHDRAVGALPTDWPMKVVEAWSSEGIMLTHYPALTDHNHAMTIAGHLHPAVKLQGAGANEGKLPCFHYDAAMRCLTLPAVGEFTGTALIRPARGDRVWISMGQEVRELDLRMIHTKGCR